MSTTDAARANAPAMPEMNRRRLLLGLAAASTAAATVTVAAVAEAAPAENPELLRLGNAFPAIEAEFEAAGAALKATIADWAPQWPRAPKSILHKPVYLGRDIERDLTGDPYPSIGPNGDVYYPRIATLDGVEWGISNAKRILKGRSIDKRKHSGMDRAGWERELSERTERYREVKSYEDKKARVLKASNYKAVYDRRVAAWGALVAAITDIMAQPETSMAGILIKAQALAAWNKVERGEHFAVQALSWGPAFAEAVLRQAGQKGGVA